VITAVDTNVLLDGLHGHEPHGSESRDRLKVAYDAGTVLVCGIVYAELAPAFDDWSRVDGTLR